MIQNALPLLLLALAAGFFIAAAVSDFRRFIIPNRYSLILLLLFAAYVLAVPTDQSHLINEKINLDQLLSEGGGGAGLLGGSTAVWAKHLLVGGVVFALSTVGFSFGFFGGGDAKLLTVAAFWAGPKYLAALIAITGVAGGLLALAVLASALAARRKLTVSGLAAGLAGSVQADIRGEDARDVAGAVAAPPLPPVRKAPVPYGIAISLAGLYVLYRLALPLL
tara:strand:- start:8136 stop:8801 length:666 start_codon:yes stop_codon:yes gene_type:complete